MDSYSCIQYIGVTMEEVSNKYTKRNFTLNLFEGTLFITGSSLISAQTVLPALIYRLGGSNITVGVLGVVVWVGLFLPQIFAARYAQTQTWKKTWAIRLGLIQRFVLLLAGLAILLFGGYQPTLSLWLFLIFYAGYQILTGIATPFWFDMFAKLTPIGLRGRLLGIRIAFAGAGGFAGAFLLTWLFRSFGFPFNYSIAVACTFVLQFISILLQYKLVEDIPSVAFPKQSLTAYLHQVQNILTTNKPFEKFLTTSILLVLALMPSSFFTVYGLKKFHLDENILGQFTLMMVIGQGIGGLANGFIADHFGNKRALIVASATMLAASLIALIAPTAGWFIVSFALLGMTLGSELMIRQNLALEFSSIDQRSTYIGIMNTTLAPLYFVGILGGWIIDRVGFTSVFLFGSVCSVTGIVLLMLTVQEPRSEH
jgi:MFS family permease